MTEEEVQQIYDYLHEYYRYEDGELICIKGIKAKKQKKVLGWFVHHDNGLAYTHSEIVINKKRISKPLSHFVFIYHHKKIPKFIKHNDGNPMNCKIENLSEIETPSMKKLFAHKNKKPKGFSITKDNKFCVRYKFQGKNHSVGAYDNEEIALKAYLYWEHLIEIQKEPILTSIEMVKEKYPLPMRNKHGYIGIYKYKQKYVAKFRNKCFGTYNTPIEAHAAYLKAKEDYAKTA